MATPDNPVTYYEVSRSLAKIKPAEPIFTADQRKVLNDLAITHLQRYKLPFNRENLKASMATLAFDSLPRGLALLGTETLTPQDNVRRLVKAGLDHRTYVKTTIEEALSSDEKDLRVMDGKYVGAYAFDKDLVSRTYRVLGRFNLTPNISACDTLAYQYDARKQLLPVFAATAIEALPREQFSQATLDTFPQPFQQAKLVRNCLMSLAARGIPLPAIAIDDLRALLIHPHLTEQLADTTLTEFFGLIDRPEIITEEARVYGQALLAQVRETLISSKLSPIDIPIEEGALISLRDSLYRAFSPTFLLLHPALEEKKLVTEPSKASESDYSLWRSDLSVVVDEFRVPTVEALFRAERLAEAQGYTADRYRTAINAWKTFRTLEREQVEKLERLKKEIRAISTRVLLVRSGAEEMPRSAFDLVYTYYQDRYINWSAAKRRLADHQATVQDALEIKTAAQDYYSSILLRNNGSIPNEIPLPESINQRRERSDLASKRSMKAIYNRQKERLFAALSEDYLEQHGLTGISFESWMSLDPEKITEQLEKIVEAQNGIGVLDLDVVRSYIETYLPQIRDRRYRGEKTTLGSTPKLPGDQQRFSELKEINLLFVQWDREQGTKRGTLEDQIRILFRRYCATNQLRIYQDLLSLEEKKSTSTTRPGTSRKNVWSKAEMLDWYNKVMSSTLFVTELSASDLAQDITQVQYWLTQYDKLIPNLRTIILPKNIPNRSEFEQYIIDTVAKLTDKLQEDLPKKPKARLEKFYRLQRISQQIDCLRGFLPLLRSDLVPIKEGVGFSAQEFLYCIKERIAIAAAALALPDDRVIYTEANEEYQKLAFDSYIKNLTGKKQRMQVELAEIIVDDPAKTRFLQTVGSLNLIKKENEITL